MPFAAGVKFSKDEFSRYYNPGDFKMAVDDFCVVRDSALGIDRVGFVSILEGRAPIQMEHLPKVLRLATESEIEQWYEMKIRERDAYAYVIERAQMHNLDVKINGVTFVPEKAQVLVQFTSDRRIDFRELVKDLGGHFKTRIEMWQIGARQAAGVKGGLGICGRELCCSSWLNDFPAIAMRHAKEQDIFQPRSKLSGNCGRLRCCLRYEHEMYLHLADGVPQVGCKSCSFAGGPAVVIDRNLLKGMLAVRKENGETTTVPFAEFVPDPDQPRQRREGRGRRRSFDGSEEDREYVGGDDDDREE